VEVLSAYLDPAREVLRELPGIDVIATNDAGINR
jgi:hypothetical protein